MVHRDLPGRELPPGVAGEGGLELVQDDSPQPGDAGRDDVGHLQQLHPDLLFVEELLLRQVEDLVALPSGGLADHLAESELDVLRGGGEVSNVMRSIPRTVL